MLEVGDEVDCGDCPLASFLDREVERWGDAFGGKSEGEVLESGED